MDDSFNVPHFAWTTKPNWCIGENAYFPGIERSRGRKPVLCPEKRDLIRRISSGRVEKKNIVGPNGGGFSFERSVAFIRLRRNKIFRLNAGNIQFVNKLIFRKMKGIFIGCAHPTPQSIAKWSALWELLLLSEDVYLAKLGWSSHPIWKSIDCIAANTLSPYNTRPIERFFLSKFNCEIVSCSRPFAQEFLKLSVYMLRDFRECAV